MLLKKLLIYAIFLQVLYSFYILVYTNSSLNKQCIYLEGNINGQKVLIKEIQEYNRIENYYFKKNSNGIYVCEKYENIKSIEDFKKIILSINNYKNNIYLELEKEKNKFEFEKRNQKISREYLKKEIQKYYNIINLMDDYENTIVSINLIQYKESSYYFSNFNFLFFLHFICIYILIYVFKKNKY